MTNTEPSASLNLNPSSPLSHPNVEVGSTQAFQDQEASTAANRAYFDAKASTYDDDPTVRAITASIVRGLLKEYEFDSERKSVLDFACGTGACSVDLRRLFNSH